MVKLLTNILIVIASSLPIGCWASNEYNIHFVKKGFSNIYKVEVSKCVLSITTFDEGSLNESIIKYYHECSLPLSEQAEILGYLFDSALSREGGLFRITKLAWGRVQSREILNSLIIYSSNSKTWKEVQSNPSYMNLSNFIKYYLNNNQVFYEFEEILKSRGIEMSLGIVEKILVGDINNAKQFIDQEIFNTLKKSKFKGEVPYSAVLWFNLVWVSSPDLAH